MGVGVGVGAGADVAVDDDVVGEDGADADVGLRVGVVVGAGFGTSENDGT